MEFPTNLSLPCDMPTPRYNHSGFFMRLVDLPVGECVSLWDLALDDHYHRNPHHPQYKDTHIGYEFTETDKREMLCDFFSCVLTSQCHEIIGKYNLKEWTLTEIANQCKVWPNWKYVVETYENLYNEGGIFYKEEFDSNPESKVMYSQYNFRIKERWPPAHQLKKEEKLLKATLMAAIRHGKSWVNNNRDILWETETSLDTLNHNLEAIQAEKCADEFFKLTRHTKTMEYYLHDYSWHVHYIREMADEMFPSDQELKKRCYNHDADKLDPASAIIYALKWIHKNPCNFFL